MNREMENLKAVALSYSGTGSPTVSSKGQGEYASQIVSMAKECGLYVHEDPVLLSQLESLKEGQSIPKGSSSSSRRSSPTPTSCRASSRSTGRERTAPTP